MSRNLPVTADEAIQAPPSLIAPRTPDLLELRRRFDMSRDAVAEHRRRAMRDRDYYDGNQLSPTVLEALRKRKQPEVITNRIRPAIDGVLGVMEAGRTDPRAYPRNPGDDDAADIVTKVLRYIAEVNRFDQVKLDCAETHQVEGVCAVMIEGGPDDIPVVQIRWEEFYWDPHSRRPDFHDARWLGVAKWMDATDVQAAYPEGWTRLGDPYSISMDADTFEDRPDDQRWVDRERRRLIVCEEYRRSGDGWERVVFCGAGVLDAGPSPYRDDKGRLICPIEATTAYIDRKNERYGRVRDMIPLQDEINSRRSRYLHLANMRQVQKADPDAQDVDEKTAREEAARPDGVIPPGWQIVPTVDIAGAQAILLQDAKAELERMGPTPAVLGRQDNASQSGRARLVLQQAGMTELARVLGRFEDFEQRCYKQMWWRAQQFWTAPKWVRITDDVRAPEFLQVNEPVMGPVLEPVTDEAGQPVADEFGQPAMRVAMGQVGTERRLAELDVDIIIDSVPDTANLQAEVWKDLLELMRIVPPDDPRFELAVEMSPLADKSRVIERLKGFREKQGQENAGQQQAAMEAQQAAAALEGEERKAKAANLMASARKSIAEADKTQLETAMMAAPAFEGFAAPL